MASKYWIKLYHEILDDHKMGRMPDRLWRRTIELFLIAGEHDLEGELPCLEDIAWRLRLDEEELRDDLAYLQNLGIITIEDGIYIVEKFAERQSAMSGTERVRRYRDSKKKQEYNDTHYADVTNNETNRYTDKIRRDIDKDIDKNKILLSDFCDITGIALPFNTGTYAKWLTEISDWVRLGVDKDTIQRAYILAMEKDYTVARPGGLTNFIRGEVSKVNNQNKIESQQIKASDGNTYNTKGEVVG
jgi:DNA repair exonuclease SbcCD nuclease subunit